MKIELKNVKYAAFASQETNCFNATIYVDGVKAGTVQNQGNGGPDDIHPRDLRKKLDDFAKTLPPIDVSYMYKDGLPHTIDPDAEIMIGELLNEWLKKRDLKRLCAKHILFRVPGKTYEEGVYASIRAMYTPEAKAEVIARHGVGVVFLNDTI